MAAPQSRTPETPRTTGGTRAATKDSIWPSPDWRGFVARGADPVAAALVKAIRDRLPTSSAGPTNPDDYVRMMSLVRDRLSAVRSVEDVKRARGDLLEAAGWPRDGRTAPSMAARRLLSSVWRDGQDTIHVDYRDTDRANALVAAGWPGATEAWRRGHVVRRDADGGWMLARGGSILADGFATETDAWAWLAAKVGATSAACPSRPTLSRVCREGLPSAGVPEDVSGNAIGDEFGLAVADLGRRGPSPRATWEALHDLAAALGVEHKALGLGGILSLRTGEAAGTTKGYDRASRTILLPPGHAGELARTWGLAFYHWAEEGGFSADQTAAIDLNLRRSDPEAAEKVVRERIALDGRIAEVARVSAQRTAYLARDPHAASHPEGAAYLDACDRWLADASTRMLPEARRRLAAAESRDRAAGESALAEAGRRLEASHGGDWTSPGALFARCLECAVNDALSASGGRNQLLVHGVEEGRHRDANTDPYPRGRQRLAANAAVLRTVRTSHAHDCLPGPQPRLG
jgi:hypothetical protein